MLSVVTIQWRIQDVPLGGANLRRRCFLAKTYVKMKELDPVGGEKARTGGAPPLDPPML